MSEEKQSKKSKTKKKTKQDQQALLEQQAAEYLAGWKRAQADYQNLKKQSTQEKAELSKYVTAQVLNQFFPILDNFSLALEHIPEAAQAEGWVQGLKHLQTQIETTLEEMNVTKIDTTDKEFDVNLHEAIEKKQSDDHTSNMIIKEVRSGYQLGDMVILPAKVIVAE